MEGPLECKAKRKREPRQNRVSDDSSHFSPFSAKGTGMRLVIFFGPVTLGELDQANMVHALHRTVPFHDTVDDSELLFL